MVSLAISTNKLEKKATRAAYGKTLVELSNDGLPIVAVDADLSGSTTTKFFAQSSPENKKKFFNVGIAEQNMIDVAAGLALADNIVFTGSFAVFGTGRVYDQIRNTIAYSKLNVKIAPTHAGISVGPDGGSHQMLEDIALMRELPGMKILVPADYVSACESIRLAAYTQGPVYIRMGRAAVPTIYSEDIKLEIGKSNVLHTGSDVSIIACGVEINEAMKATKYLEQQGISVDLIDAFCIKPLDKSTILSSLKKTKCAVVAEEHSIYGGLGSAVAELASQDFPVFIQRVGINDCFGKSGQFEELMQFFSLDSNAIVEAAKKVIALKNN